MSSAIPWVALSRASSRPDSTLEGALAKTTQEENAYKTAQQFHRHECRQACDASLA
jgi:hypothetical protein